MLPQFHHCDCEMCKGLNFGTFFKFPCIVRIYAWFFIHYKNHYRESHANHVINDIRTWFAFHILFCLINVYVHVFSYRGMRKQVDIHVVMDVQSRYYLFEHCGPFRKEYIITCKLSVTKGVMNEIYISVPAYGLVLLWGRTYPDRGISKLWSLCTGI